MVSIARIAVCLLIFVSAAYGQFEDEETRRDFPLWIRALVDARVVGTGAAPSWRHPISSDPAISTERGKTRWGGRATANGLDRMTRFTIAQLALEVRGTLPGGITPRLQINWDFDIEVDGDWPLGVEASLRKEWGDGPSGFALQAGIMNAPFSMEHDGPAITPSRTLTPSALNTWLWEELRFVGVEAERFFEVEDFEVSLLGGLGWGPDELGRLLTVRGWVLSDYLSGLNSELPVVTQTRTQPVYLELDDRPAVYANVSVRDPWKLGEFRAGYFDNLGELATARVWDTRFGTAGVLLQPLPHVEFLAQWLAGETTVAGRTLDSSFTTIFPLLSFHYDHHRLSARYDFFRIHDRDGGMNTAEKGNAVTLAYFFEYGLYHRVGAEWMRVSSHRPAGERDPSDDHWQISYRFRY